MRRTLPALVAVALWAATPAWALDRQFRRVTLVDGRTLTAEILSTEPEGLLLQVPQGQTLISFELLLDMIPIGELDYTNQTAWVVYYRASDRLRPDVVELLTAIPGIEPQSVDEAGHGIGVDMGLKIPAICPDGNVVCIADVVKSTPWKWVVTADDDLESGGVIMKSKLNTTGGPALETVTDGHSRDDLWEALHTAIGLAVPTGGAPRAAGLHDTVEASAMEEKRVVALSFVPFPGVPSLAQHDTGGFALALAVVAPSTAVWIGAVGETGQSTPEIVAISFAGYYAVTVLANQVTGLRSMEKKAMGVSAVPTTRGAGGVVVLAGEL